MLEKFLRKSVRCENCRKFLADEAKHIGFCKECAPKEIARLKKRIWISGIIGAVIMVIVLSAVRYAQVNSFVANGTAFGSDTVFIPIFSGYLPVNGRSFNSIKNFSITGYIILAAVCFLTPFGSYVRLGFDENRVKSEINAYKSEPITARAFVSSKSQRQEGAGLFVIEIIIMVVSGPFFFFHRLYKIKQLKDYMR